MSTTLKVVTTKCGVSTTHVVEFTIPNYGFYVGNPSFIEELKSPQFYLYNNINHFRVFLVWRKNLQNSSWNGYTTYLQFEPEAREKIKGSFSFSLLRKGKERWNRESRTEHHTVLASSSDPIRWGFNDYFSQCSDHKYIGDYLNDNDLVIKCTVNLQPNSLTVMLCKMPMSVDFANLLSSGDMTDVTLKVRENELRAHKLILAARSPVFNTMFKNDMVEKRLNTVEITDMDFGVVKSILNFIYTNKVSNIEENAEDLLRAAEKYQLLKLKNLCENWLSTNLTVENSARIFILADLHQAKQLRKSAVEFILLHKQEVSKTEGMELAKEEHPQALLRAFL